MNNPFVIGAATSAGNTIVVLISFLLLFLLLKRFAGKPVSEMMEKRAQTIANDLDSAKEANEEANRLKAEQQTELKQIQTESAAIIEKAHSNAAKIEKELTTEARASIAQMKKQAQADIELERQHVLEEAKNEISLLSFQIAEKLLEKEVDHETHAELIDKFIERLADSNEVK